MLYLPSKSTLKDFTEVISMKPGISPFIMNTLSRKAANLSESERNCCLLLDEISLKPGYNYDIKNDCINGFVDYGPEGRENKGANRALVFMLRGLQSKFKQTIGYFFSQNACPGSTLEKLLKSTLDKVEEMGFRVRVVIGDVGSSNVSMVKKLGITEEKPYFHHNGKKIFFMYDPPHLLKCTRNNLSSHDFHVNGDLISWKFINKFFLQDKNLKIRMAPRLKQKHLSLPPFSKMKVQLAAQILSRSVYTGMMTQVETNKLPVEALPTADFILKMNNLFDCFNSENYVHPNTYKRAISDKSSHIQFFNEMIAYIKSWDIGNVSNDVFKFNKGWIITIRSVMMLWDDLKKEGEFRFLLTRQLNQDPLENFFGMVRMDAGCNKDPPVSGFHGTIKKTMMASLLKPPPGKNCEDDMDNFLLGKLVKKLLNFRNSGRMNKIS